MNIFIRPGTIEDTDQVVEAFGVFLQRQGSSEYIRNALSKYPSAMAFYGDELVGFAYCGFMAPDLLELANISLHPDYRGLGIGTQLLEFLESEVAKNYSAIMLTNSKLYGNPISAENFYLDNGYTLLAGTEKTNLYWKNLLHTDL